MVNCLCTLIFYTICNDPLANMQSIWMRAILWVWAYKYKWPKLFAFINKNNIILYTKINLHGQFTCAVWCSASFGCFYAKINFMRLYRNIIYTIIVHCWSYLFWYIFWLNSRYAQQHRFYFIFIATMTNDDQISFLVQIKKKSKIHTQWTKKNELE